MAPDLLRFGRGLPPARGRLFAPVANPGLIVVDEEHEPSYKQAEAPRYNARDVAVMRGHMEKCAVLLGSATPALESFYNARRGKYFLSSMPHRVDNRAMPVMRIVDMRTETEREGRLNVFSRALVEAIRRRLENGEQTILFLNRRGYATTVLCPQCGYTAVCPHCSVSMTYHRATAEIRCHICGHSAPAPSKCPACGLPTLKFSGIGTQRIESAVRAVFPQARVQRMDADTAAAKHAYTNILGDFKAGKTDILIGTQMIAKGLHFPGVTLVGVVCADSSLHLPDFRAAERTFQLLLQVAGRAGRGEIPGEVIIQTFSPAHPAIQSARRQDYAGFCDQELAARSELMYPPFTHLICLTFEGARETAVLAAADRLARRLRALLHPAIIQAGPMPAPLSKIKGRSRQQIILRSVSVKAMTGPLQAALAELPARSDAARRGGCGCALVDVSTGGPARVGPSNPKLIVGSFMVYRRRFYVRIPNTEHFVIPSRPDTAPGPNAVYPPQNSRRLDTSAAGGQRDRPRCVAARWRAAYLQGVHIPGRKPVP